MDIEPEPTWGRLEVYDGQNEYHKLIQTIDIINGTLPAGITSTHHFLYVKFTWGNIPVAIGQRCPTVVDCVKFTILLDSAPGKLLCVISEIHAI